MSCCLCAVTNSYTLNPCKVVEYEGRDYKKAFFLSDKYLYSYRNTII